MREFDTPTVVDFKNQIKLKKQTQISLTSSIQPEPEEEWRLSWLVWYSN